MKTVQEFFESDKIFKDDVARIADESSYWESSANFVLQKWETDMDELSEKQVTWLGKIQEDMVERRIKAKR